MRTPDDLDTRIRELVWKLVETSPPPPPFPSTSPHGDESESGIATSFGGPLGRFRRGTSRGFVGAIVVTALIVVVFFVPLPHVSLFKRLVRPTQLPTAAAPIPVGTQLAELKGSDAVAGDEFGSSVAISATTAVVFANTYARPAPL